MKNIHRTSEASLRQHRRVLSAVPIVALLACAWQLQSASADVSMAVALCTGVVKIAVVVAVRQYRRYSAYAERHSLELRQDALILRDGEVETCIPFSAVSSVIVMGSMGAPRSVSLGLVDGTRQLLDGYADLARVVDFIVLRVEVTKVKAKRWVHVASLWS